MQHTVRTPEARERFLEALATKANVSMACEAANISRRVSYSWKDEDPAFAEDWHAALAIGIAALEDEANRRAFHGVDEPVFYQGAECGQVRKYSDTLAIFLLKAHKPEKYREQIAHVGADGGAIRVEDSSALELARRLAYLLASPTAQLPQLPVLEAEAA